MNKRMIVSALGALTFFSTSLSIAATAQYTRSTRFSTTPFEAGKTLITLSDNTRTNGRNTFQMQFGSKLAIIPSTNNGVVTNPGSVETNDANTAGLANNTNMVESVSVSTTGCASGIKITTTGFTADSTNVGACYKCQALSDGHIYYGCANDPTPNTCTSLVYPSCFAGDKNLGRFGMKRISGTSTPVYYTN